MDDDVNDYGDSATDDDVDDDDGNPLTDGDRTTDDDVDIDDDCGGGTDGCHRLDACGGCATKGDARRRHATTGNAQLSGVERGGGG